jgi:hypothetical protein
VTPSANIFGIVSMEQRNEYIFPAMYDKDYDRFLMVKIDWWQNRLQFFTMENPHIWITLCWFKSSYKTLLKNEIIKKKMKGRHKKFEYQVISFFQDLMLFFIRYFLCFPSHITRNILFFVYSDYHKISFIYPYLEEQGLHSSCVIDVHPNPSSETNEKDCVHILICLEPDHSCHLIDRKANQLPSITFYYFCWSFP